MWKSVKGGTRRRSTSANPPSCRILYRQMLSPNYQIWPLLRPLIEFCFCPKNHTKRARGRATVSASDPHHGRARRPTSKHRRLAAGRRPRNVPLVRAPSSLTPPYVVALVATPAPHHRSTHHTLVVALRAPSSTHCAC